MYIPRKLIEVALPLEKINQASAREKSIRHGHPSTLHLWWARRPLATARAIIFAQMVDDPSEHPDLFPTEEAQATERQRLFRLIEQLVLWENTTNADLLSQARNEIWTSWKRTCAHNYKHPQAATLFNPDRLPAFHDPFAGGGALPLEAQRLGLESYASDLNPVAVLINKAMIEIPPTFAGQPPVNPGDRGQGTGDEGQGTGDEGQGTGDSHHLFPMSYPGATGLAADVRYYGQWMRDEAYKRIGHLYPKITVTEAMAQGRPDLESYVGTSLTVIAWLWSRTVRSNNPAFAHVHVPLISTFMLSTKPGKKAYIEPVVNGDSYHFTVKMGNPPDEEAAKRGTKFVKIGKPPDEEAAKRGTKQARVANFRCILSGVPIEGSYIKAESMAGRMGTRMMAIVAEGHHGRVYLPPTPEHEAIAQQAQPAWKPDQEMNRKTTNLVSGRGYGFFTWADIFTPRQLVALTTLSDLVQEARQQVLHDYCEVHAAYPHARDETPLAQGGNGAVAYADAVAVYLALALSKLSDAQSSFCRWKTTMDQSIATFGRQALPMVWDYSEANVFGNMAGDPLVSLKNMMRVVERMIGNKSGQVYQNGAQTQSISVYKVISTDPPYYDNIGYADLSDFFYVWLRHSLHPIFPDLFAMMATPKDEELVAAAYRHSSKKAAEEFFLNGMKQAMQRLAEQCHPAYPVTIYYAFKQAENDMKTNGTSSTGWETFLNAVIQSGFTITGTWPVRSEMMNRMVGMGTNALASSIVLVCRPRSPDMPNGTRRNFLSALRDELPEAVRLLQLGNIAPVDLAQASIGPGMSIYTRYAKVLDAEGTVLTVRDALVLINQILDEVLAEQEGDYDAETRWALAWFEQHGFAEGGYGVAETLSKAKNTSVDGMVASGLVASQGGKVRLLRPQELPPNWDPTTDTRLTVWEMVHHLVRTLEHGEEAAGALAARIGERADEARELSYRLYILCERKKRAAEALAYNSLVQSWPEIMRLAPKDTQQGTLL